MTKKRYEQSIFKEVIDKETGEILSAEQTKIFTKEIKTDSFYMTFIDYISPLFNLKTDVAKSILTGMCVNAEYNTGKVKLTTEDRKIVCQLLGISPNTLTNNLKILKDLKIIEGERSNFQINPQIHWKGDTKTRAALLEDNNIKITFSIE